MRRVISERSHETHTQKWVKQEVECLQQSESNQIIRRIGRK